jgi:hypothetical protein
MDNHNIRQEEAKVSSGQQAKAIGWSLVGDFSSQGIGFIVSIVLARLLTPELFGLVGMSMVFISLLYLLVDGGFSTALVQQKISDDLVYDSVFWINLSISLLLMLVVWFLGPSIGRFYENPEITSLVRWLSVLLPIKALSMVPEAVLRRNLRFKVLGVRLLFAGVAGGMNSRRTHPSLPKRLEATFPMFTGFNKGGFFGRAVHIFWSGSWANNPAGQHTDDRKVISTSHARLFYPSGITRQARYPVYLWYN